MQFFATYFDNEYLEIVYRIVFFIKKIFIRKITSVHIRFIDQFCT